MMRCLILLKKYLKEKQLTYGMVIDVIKVLEEDGYAIPSNKDKIKVGHIPLVDIKKIDKKIKKGEAYEYKK